jgi:DNA invertase Pin-like site-specific DNA recombinase
MGIILGTRKSGEMKKSEVESGAVTDLPVLLEALYYARSGDTLIVWKLDRLARSVRQLIETIEKLRVRNIGFRSLTESIDTTTAQGCRS